jgi:hypothetical protein
MNRALLTADTIVEFAWHNIAAKRFANLSPEQIIKRMATGLKVKYLPKGTPRN